MRTTVLLCLVAMATAQSERDAEILRNDFQIDPEEGTYQADMETSNNIRMRSSGISYKGDQPETGSVYVEGESSWITPEGKTVLLKYTSDEGGYVPVVSIS
ncbi:larval cuticle protein 9-like [Amphibalanus amphitrite]|uniref:larval cuticle protein 9-like n=1 Tax=Amphibalanus amphitrite TaxID=1232801 RepID=UPI001C918DD0|nr:larval cuticle protein 9-like [Amphibalanus amphitrite]